MQNNILSIRQLQFMEDIWDIWKKQNIPKETISKLNNELRVSDNRLNNNARFKRIAALQEALSWKKGADQKNRIVTNLYEIREYSVAIAKPGKEAADNYRGCKDYITGEKRNNPNDMNPCILKKGERFEKDLTFQDMFSKIELLMHADLFGLEIMGSLLYRAAFMLDHNKNKEGNWRYNPPEFAVKELERRIPEITDLPIRVLLHFLEVLSLNEDIKVYTLGYKELKKDYGRINTLLTFTHLVAVLLNRRSLAKFAGTFARPPSGMAPLPKTKASEYFPLLSDSLH